MKGVESSIMSATASTVVAGALLVVLGGCASPSSAPLFPSSKAPSANAGEVSSISCGRSAYPAEGLPATIVFSENPFFFSVVGSDEATFYERMGRIRRKFSVPLLIPSGSDRRGDWGLATATGAGTIEGVRWDAAEQPTFDRFVPATETVTFAQTNQAPRLQDTHDVWVAQSDPDFFFRRLAALLECSDVTLGDFDEKFPPQRAGHPVVAPSYQAENKPHIGEFRYLAPQRTDRVHEWIGLVSPAGPLVVLRLQSLDYMDGHALVFVSSAEGKLKGMAYAVEIADESPKGVVVRNASSNIELKLYGSMAERAGMAQGQLLGTNLPNIPFPAFWVSESSWGAFESDLYWNATAVETKPPPAEAGH